MVTLIAPRKTAATATTSGTLTRGSHTPVDATAAALTMTLPTNAPVGVEVSVEKVDASTNAVTISGTIRGASSTISLTSQYESRTFLSEGGGSWRPTSDHRTQSSIDLRYGFAKKVDPALGNGSSDATAAINAAITAAAGGTVIIGPGTYMVDADYASGKSVLLNVPGTTLQLDAATVLKAKPNALTRYSVVRISATDCTVRGGTILGDVGTHTGTTGEWGHGVEILSTAHRARVESIYITKCWGDGICVGDDTASFSQSAKVADVALVNVTADNNRRGGLSLIAALRPRVVGGAYINTGQTAFTSPGHGVALEPNGGGTQDIVDAELVGVVASGNVGRGFYTLGASGRTLTATFSACRAISNNDHGMAYDGPGDFTITGCTFANNGQYGMFEAPTFTGSAMVTGAKATGNTKLGIAVAGGTRLLASHAENNGWAGIYLSGTSARATACTARGNNKTDSYYGQIVVEDGATDAYLKSCHSDAGTNATKPAKGFEVKTTASGARLHGCTTSGTFTQAPYVNGPADTWAFPVPGQSTRPVLTYSRATETAAVTALRTSLATLGLVTDSTVA